MGSVEVVNVSIDLLLPSSLEAPHLLEPVTGTVWRDEVLLRTPPKNKRCSQCYQEHSEATYFNFACIAKYYVRLIQDIP